MTQLEELRKRRDEVIALVLDPNISREEALSVLNCSVRAIYDFMAEENIVWRRKPHSGKNQYTDNPVEKLQRNRDMAKNEVPISDLYFNEDVDKLPLQGIYKIVSATGGVYIGRAAWSFRKRFNEHRAMLRRGKHHCIGLQRAYSNNPSMSFEVLQVIEIATEGDEELAAKEQEWWHLYEDSGFKLYNGEPTNSSVRHTQESRDKISLSKRKAFTQDEKQRMRELRAEGRSINHIRLALKAKPSRVKDFFAQEENTLEEA